MSSLSPGRFDFSFGYEHQAGRGHLIVARRAPGAPIAEPLIDASTRLGEGTRCARDKLVITTCVVGRCAVRFE
jgi:hypothetical protein